MNLRDDQANPLWFLLTASLSTWLVLKVVVWVGDVWR